MSADITWNDDGTVSIDPPKRPKKLTATRFAAVLGLNKWTTEFQVWCEVTRAWMKPFEETVYTRAGKVIEPKQIAYMRESYAMDDLRDPTDVYGPDYFSKTYGNFFTHPVLGGMWDSILVDEDGEPTGVLEFKTTKRAEDWEDDVPEYYALQAALYAYLLGVEDVIMVASFLTEPGIYDHPEDFVPDASNTMTVEFRLHERYPDFEEDYVRPALAWWREYVETGNSPRYDENRDGEYLAGLRDASLSPETDIDGLLREYAETAEFLEGLKVVSSPKEKRLKEITAILKKYALENIGDHDTATFSGHWVDCKLVVTRKTDIDKARLEKDGLLEKYSKETESSKFTVKLNKDKE